MVVTYLLLPKQDMIGEPHGYGSGMLNHLGCLMKALIDTCPICNSHTEKTMKNRIVQLQQFKILKFERCINHTSPQEVIVVQINEDLLTPMDWVERGLSIKDFPLASSANYLVTHQLSFFGLNAKESNDICC